MQSESLNLIPAFVRGTKEYIWLELPDTTELQLPRLQQIKLSDYIDNEIRFGINPEYIDLADMNDKFNACLANLKAVTEKKDRKELQFSISGHPLTVKTDNEAISQSDIGKYFKVTFDTFFSHVFDANTQDNLTI